MKGERDGIGRKEPGEGRGLGIVAYQGFATPFKKKEKGLCTKIKKTKEVRGDHKQTKKSNCEIKNYKNQQRSDMPCFRIY